MNRVFAHYALAYPITFESGKVIVATPIAPVRNKTLNEAVRSHPSPDYLFMADSSWVQAFREATEKLGVNARCERLDDFVVCRPSPKLLPERLGEVWFRSRWILQTHCTSEPPPRPTGPGLVP